MRGARRFVGLWFVLCGLATPAAAQGTPDHFTPFEFLVGYCWAGTFANGRDIDTHCYEWMLGRQFIRDRHEVTGTGDYRGETIYQWDATAKRVSYRYWNTEGGVSNGTFTVEGSVLRAAEEEYLGADGSALRLRAAFTRVGETRYDVATEALVKGEWRPARSVRYLRVETRSAPGDAAHQAAVAQLRSTHSAWEVTTEFLKPDGGVARSAEGTYVFDWVIEDRLLRGESAGPELKTKAAIQFSVDEVAGQVVMASVGGDGHLGVRGGPADGETPTTPDTSVPDGSTMRLRFTRFNVTGNRFESRMEVSGDSGASWQPGNHQVFVRKGTP